MSQDTKSTRIEVRTVPFSYSTKWIVASWNLVKSNYAMAFVLGLMSIASGLVLIGAPIFAHVFQGVLTVFLSVGFVQIAKDWVEKRDTNFERFLYFFEDSDFLARLLPCLIFASVLIGPWYLWEHFSNQRTVNLSKQIQAKIEARQTVIDQSFKGLKGLSLEEYQAAIDRIEERAKKNEEENSKDLETLASIKVSDNSNVIWSVIVQTLLFMISGFCVPLILFKKMSFQESLAASFDAIKKNSKTLIVHMALVCILLAISTAMFLVPLIFLVSPILICLKFLIYAAIFENLEIERLLEPKSSTEMAPSLIKL